MLQKYKKEVSYKLNLKEVPIENIRCKLDIGRENNIQVCRYVEKWRDDIPENGATHEQRKSGTHQSDQRFVHSEDQLKICPKG